MSISESSAKRGGRGRVAESWGLTLGPPCRIPAPSFVLWPNKGARAMSEHANPDEIQIRTLLEAWAAAVRRHDVPAILAHHEPDMLMFDVPPPLQCKGIA